MNKKKINIALLVLTLVFIVALTACDKKENNPSQTEGTSGEGTKKDEDNTKGNTENHNEDMDDEDSNMSEEGEGSEGGIKMNTAGAKIDYFEIILNGGFSGEFFDYKIKREDGKLYLTYEDVDTRTKGGIKREIEEEVAEKLREIYDRLEVEKWNGFDKAAEGVFDGQSFLLAIGFSNGEYLSAKAYHLFPKNFWEFRDEITELFQGYIDKPEK